MSAVRRAFLLATALVVALTAGAADHPNLSKGFQPDRVYQFGDVDTVDLYTGGLKLALPIGPEYPVNARFKYALTLSYNSQIWDFDAGTFLVDEMKDEWMSWVASYPTPRSNAGFGWVVSIGKIFEPESIGNDTFSWIYEAPDGSEHTFSMGENDTLGMSNDGSYIRATRNGPDLFTLEFPDGDQHLFYRYQVRAQNGKNVYEWRLRFQQDRFGNYVEVDYPADGSWKLTDNHGRVQQVHFQNTSYTESAYQGRMIDKIVLTGYQNRPMEYDFHYEDADIETSCENMNSQVATPQRPGMFRLPILTRLTLPDGSYYEMTYATGFRKANCEQGAITDLRLPTGGSMHWGYIKYKLPMSPCDSWYHQVAQDDIPGIGTRTLYDENGADRGTWEYKPVLSASLPDHRCTGGSGNRFIARRGPSPAEYLTNTVKSPGGTYTTHYFSAWPEFSNSPNGYDRDDRGLPFRRMPDGSRLSAEIRSCATCSPLRSIYMTWEYESDARFGGSRNRRLKEEKTVFNDDGNRWTQTTFDNYDGLGHYRSKTVTSNFEGTPSKTTFTNYNPNVGTLRVDSRGVIVQNITMPPRSQPWIVDTYDFVSVTQSDYDTPMVTQFCFDKTNGFLERKRVLENGAPGENDLLTVYARSIPFNDGRGNVVREQYFGGDGQKLDTTYDLCAVTVPSDAEAQYTIFHTYDGGVIETSQYLGATFKTLDVDIDMWSGQPQSRKDKAGVVTNYDYDDLLRPRWEKPVTGHGAWREFKLTNYGEQGLSYSQLQIISRPNGSETGVLTEQQFHYDAFGRLWREKNLLPDGTWNVRETTYDNEGRKETVSEQELSTGASPVHKTTFVYDALGRVDTVTPPDGAVGLIDFDYSGSRVVYRKSKVGTTMTADWSLPDDPVSGTPLKVVQETTTTTTRHDGHGRIYQIVEPAGPAGEDVTTTYKYTSADRLREVTTVAPEGTQTRTYTYDGRDLLETSDEPEKDVEYRDYDARGKAQRRIEGSEGSIADLKFTFDSAERVLTVSEMAGTRLLKEFIYGTASTSTNWANGKVTTAKRHNHIDGVDYVVTEEFVYGGKAGAMSEKTTSVNSGEKFHQKVEYNDLGDPEKITYPRCLHTGCKNIVADRTVTNQYSGPYLTGVPGFAKSISYHPNGLWSQILRQNDVKDIQFVENAMPRPKWLQIKNYGWGSSCGGGIQIVTQPESTSTLPNELHVRTVPSSGVTYQWYIGYAGDTSTPLPNGTGPDLFVNPSFTTPYWVKISNDCMSAYSQTAMVTVVDGNRAPADFNGDGRSDILWRDFWNGDNWIWLMGDHWISTVANIEPERDLSWRVNAVGDFTGDGKPDIFWRNYTTGQNRIWVMNGVVRDRTVPLVSLSQADWGSGAAADFDKDGTDDIVWRNYTTGENQIWLMSNGTVKSAAPLPTGRDLRWRLAGAIDINYDGHADILWRNYVTGQNGAWYMNGVVRVASRNDRIDTMAADDFDGVLLETVADTEWQMQGAGDYDGDGKADLLWRHYRTGENTAWTMEDTTRVASTSLTPIADTNVRLQTGGDGSGAVKLSEFAFANVAGPYGSALVLEATLKSETVPLAGRTVAFAFNGSPLATAVTNAAGLATATVPPSTVPGSYTATVSWEGEATSIKHAEASATVIVIKATQTIDWPQPASIGYGTPLGASQLNATVSVSGAAPAGALTFSPAAGTVLPVGTHTLTATASETTHYGSATATRSITVTLAQPAISWPAPAPIVYGTPLSATQLNATASVPGTFVYSPAAGAILDAGTHTLQATFTPSDAQNYSSSTAQVQLQVTRKVPIVNWPAPAAIVYGTPLSATQLNASADVAGTFVYTPTAGTVLNAGNGQTLSVKFTPADPANYSSVDATATINVSKATPVLTWPKPAGIIHGTPLSPTQLNATANVAGTFVYTPAAGTVLNAGAGQTLSAAFTPSDTANYNNASTTTTIDVAKATPAITWPKPAGIVYGTVLSATQLNAAADVPGTFVYTPAAGTVLNAGNGQTLSVAFTPNDTANYNNANAATTIDVARATPAIAWPKPAGIVYGTALSATQLNATASVPGSFVYTPAAGTVLNAGNDQTLSAAFTPNDTANYNNANATTTIDVAKATPVIAWPKPAEIVYRTPLSAVQLNATANVPGSFVYTPPAGTVLNAGNGQTLSVAFTPGDVANYNNASATTTIDVAKATPVITWAEPAGIVYGTALSAAQLNATADVPGSFAYAPAAGTILNAGDDQTLRVAFTPADTSNFNNADASVTIDVAKAPQKIVWATPANIVYGTPLTAAQLNARVEVVGPAPAGALTYTPAAGTVLDAGGRILTVAAAETANYLPASASVTLEVLRAPLAVTAHDKTKVYGAVLPPLTGTVVAVVNGDNVTAVYSTPATQRSGAGTYPIAAALVDPNNRLVNYDVTKRDGVLTVTPAPLTIAANSFVKQYSDPLPVLTVSYNGFVLDDTPASLIGTLSVITTAVPESAPGVYPIVASGLQSPNYDITYIGGTLTVIAEDARAYYTGVPYASTSTPSSSTGSILLSATIKDISATPEAAGDVWPGDVRKATVAFIDRDSGRTLCTATLSLIAPGDATVATATCTWSFDLGRDDAATYTIGTVIGGHYSRSATADDALITVARPVTEAITGGGYLVLATPAGSHAGDAGSHANFGLTAKYNKAGKNAQGKTTLIVRRTGPDGIRRTYQIKANAIESLALDRNKATLQSKANIQDVTDPDAPVSVEGNATLQITLTDNGEPGSSDSIAVTVWTKDGAFWFSSRWDGTRTLEQVIGGGNLVVR